MSADRVTDRESEPLSLTPYETAHFVQVIALFTLLPTTPRGRHCQNLANG